MRTFDDGNSLSLRYLTCSFNQSISQYTEENDAEAESQLGVLLTRPDQIHIKLNVFIDENLLQQNETLAWEGKVMVTFSLESSEKCNPHRPISIRAS